MNVDHQIKFAKNCLRLYPGSVRDEKMFNGLLDMLSDYREAIQQIAFFLGRTGMPMRLDLVEEDGAMLEDWMRRARQRGFECGINITATIGHDFDARPNAAAEIAIGEGYTRMTCIDGELCMGSFCWNDERMREYLAGLYQCAARAKPSFIWMDDDVRFSHTRYGCYCDNCLKIFADEYGTLYTREELRKAFESDEERSKPALGLKWLQHSRNSMAGLVRLIEKAVSGVDPGIGLGFMNCEMDHEGFGFAELADIMRGGGEGRSVLWRPGGGFYADETLSEAVWKAHRIGRQIAPLPASVETIQSEVESCPYLLMRKGPASTALETALHIAGGCTGAAFNVLPDFVSGGEPVGVFRPLFDRIARTQPFYNLLVQNFGRLPPSGVYSAWSPDLKAAVGMTADYWAGEGNVFAITGGHAKELSELGLPLSYSLENAQVVTLCGVSAKAMPHDMITRILSGGVYMDAGALDTLNAMGYGDLTGFALKEYATGSNKERYTGHPLNAGGIAGAERNASPEFFKGDAAILEATAPEAEALSQPCDYKGSILPGCTSGLFINRLGGRICVGGYFPWSILQSSVKVRQMKDLFLYLSGGTLPSYIHSYNRINHWTRMTAGGGMAIAAVNASLDELDGTAIVLKTDKAGCRCYDMECREYGCAIASDVEIPAGYGGYKAFALPTLKPWQMVLLVL